MLNRRFWRDVRTIAHMARPRQRQGSHADRLERFYRGQARDYDDFRERLLPGRRELVASLPLSPGAVWIDLGGGTARNLLLAGAALSALGHVYVIDITPSLLAVARGRCAGHAWTNVTIIEGDATDVWLPSGIADVVTCSYALTMMPAWRAVIGEASRLLRHGGTFGAVDFFVAPHHPALTQHVWPWWFAHSHVDLREPRLPALRQRFATSSLVEARTRLPYLPVGRVPYYRFTGISA